MRISTAMFFRQGQQTISTLQNGLARTQVQLATGQRILDASDDPVAAARLVDIDAAVARTEQYDRNANMARGRLAFEEQTLTDVGNVMFRMRELLLQANNDTQTPETRSFIAREAREALGQLQQLANARDASGEYVFGGYSSRSQPFSFSSGSADYVGDAGQRMIRISDTRQVADGDSGADIFMQIPNGTGQFVLQANAANTGTGIAGAASVTDLAAWDGSSYTVRFTDAENYEVLDSGGTVIDSRAFTDGDTISVSGATFTLTGTPAAGDEFAVEPSSSQDMFTTVQQFIDALSAGTDPQSRSQMHNELNAALMNIDRSMENVLDVRTRIGVRLQAIDAQQETNADYMLTLESSRVELGELDYAEAVTRLNQQLTGLQAAQQSFVRIQGLSLFNLLR